MSVGVRVFICFIIIFQRFLLCFAYEVYGKVEILYVSQSNSHIHKLKEVNEKRERELRIETANYTFVLSVCERLYMRSTERTTTSTRRRKETINEFETKTKYRK